jgi:TatD DNase family protein
MLIDSHVNLHAHQFDEDRDEVIERARAAGVALMVEISDRLETFEATHSIAMAHPDIWCTVGVHPHEARHYADLTADRLMELAARPRVVGIGECGLDFHYDLSPREIQARVFREHISASRQTGLPLVIHTREADVEMESILRDAFAEGPFKFLMHCYTSGPKLAQTAIELGGWFSVSGIASFKAAQDVREVIKMMPADRIIVETDCPYLAPTPYRGRRNEPAYIGRVLETLAEVRGWTLQEADHLTTEAFFSLFHTAPRPDMQTS